MYKLTIPGRLPGLNDYTNAARGSKFRSSTLKKTAEKTIGGYILQQLRGVRLGKVRITFHWFEPNRQRDPDNIEVARKYILDALVAYKVIPGDGWKHLATPCPFGQPVFEVDKDNPRVEVILEEVRA